MVSFSHLWLCSCLVILVVLVYQIGCAAFAVSAFYASGRLVASCPAGVPVAVGEVASWQITGVAGVCVLVKMVSPISLRSAVPLCSSSLS